MTKKVGQTLNHIGFKSYFSLGQIYFNFVQIFKKNKKYIRKL